MTALKGVLYNYWPLIFGIAMFLTFWSVRRKLRQPYSGKARAKSFASSLA
jgi:hypothetical protein